MESISGILPNLSGKVARILELTFLADSGVRPLTDFGDCVRLHSHPLPCKFFQCYSELTILTALFWILRLGIYGGIRWMRLCPVGRI